MELNYKREATNFAYQVNGYKQEIADYKNLVASLQYQARPSFNYYDDGLCGAITQKGYPCKNKRGSCPYH